MQHKNAVNERKNSEGPAAPALSLIALAACRSQREIHGITLPRRVTPFLFPGILLRFAGL